MLCERRAEFADDLGVHDDMLRVGRDYASGSLGLALIEFERRPAARLRYPVSKRLMTIATNENARGSALARAMKVNTSNSDSMVVP